MENIIFLGDNDRIAGLIVRRMIESGRWDVDSLTIAQVEEFANELICLARYRGESDHQLLRTLDVYLRTDKDSAVN